ncbi:MAG: DUF5060 domain-containing protein, partial [Gammaproteobacteria bacterium]|nr:DUF5060 domain-containing protein [Gammaproteobacteria bacterium]
MLSIAIALCARLEYWLTCRSIHLPGNITTASINGAQRLCFDDQSRNRAINRRNLWLVAGALAVSWVCPVNAASVSGTLKKWHPVTIDFSGPSSSETASPNPFLDFRLNVT